MLSAAEIYTDIVKDDANAVQNGHFDYAMFSRMSRRAELNLINWLTGGSSGANIPTPYINQKNKDWLSPFIKKYKTQPENGIITRPNDYYEWDNFYRLGSEIGAECEDDENKKDECNTPIEILDGQQFYQRCNTFIEELKPSLRKPICKMIGTTIEIAPKDIGTVELEYLRYPRFASIIPKIDPVYNDEVPDVVVDYEWDERARECLIWYIVDNFSNHTREQALKQFNAASNPKP